MINSEITVTRLTESSQRLRGAPRRRNIRPAAPPEKHLQTRESDDQERAHSFAQVRGLEPKTTGKRLFKPDTQVKLVAVASVEGNVIRFIIRSRQRQQNPSSAKGNVGKGDYGEQPAE